MQSVIKLAVFKFDDRFSWAASCSRRHFLHSWWSSVYIKQWLNYAMSVLWGARYAGSRFQIGA